MVDELDQFLSLSIGNRFSVGLESGEAGKEDFSVPATEADVGDRLLEGKQIAVGIEGFFEAEEIVGAMVNDGILIGVAGFGIVDGGIAEEEGGDVEASVVVRSMKGLTALVGDVLPDRVVVDHEGETTSVEDHVGFGAVLQVCELAIAFVAGEEEEAIAAELSQVAEAVETHDGEQQSGIGEVLLVVVQDVIVSGIGVVVGGDRAISIGDGEVMDQVRIIEV